MTVTTTETEELIVLVDEAGNPIGSAPKLASHHADTPLHRGFSCYIFNKNGEFLVAQRALAKKVWPGVWSNSVCGHPRPGESDEEAIVRRSREELGLKISEIQALDKSYRYKTPAFNGIIENEVCPVYAAIAVSGLDPNPEEVEEYLWIKWSEYIKDLNKNPNKHSYWAKDQLKYISSSDLLKKFTNIS